MLFMCRFISSNGKSATRMFLGSTTVMPHFLSLSSHSQHCFSFSTLSRRIWRYISHLFYFRHLLGEKYTLLFWSVIIIFDGLFLTLRWWWLGLRYFIDKPTLLLLLFRSNCLRYTICIKCRRPRGFTATMRFQSKFIIYIRKFSALAHLVAFDIMPHKAGTGDIDGLPAMTHATFSLLFHTP